ncbi:MULTISPECIES: LysR family transcriptional regulator [unclassified Beijerinckia]|uniref:LysR family transcriptional regulator n=1 Tax=unclassified Beijerinckia TaxID=2638183 RepID=UPI00089B2EA1|nr:MULTISPECIES: LysR family transcriptional regulator [unclassified Beijerinckia]MDH7797066.1 LysR family carnitine catabolism transcriptional activator [Beijerinckia sp. GAS462]SEC70876.1 DNA-binding transcriptional regulator, LysR family [Beijerinckia sp. 28-YEA-48]
MIYPSLNKLRTFVAVAQQGSFRKAAEQLHLSQPALSAHIRALEESLQVSLFHRTTRSVVLTNEGSRLLSGAQRAFDALDSVLLDLQEQVALLRGRITISCLPSIAYHVLPQAIAAFAKLHPDVDIRVFDELNASLVRRISNRDADFGIGPPPDEEADLHFTPLIKDPFYAVVASSHPLAFKKELTFKSLSKLPLLTLKKGTNIRHQLDQAFIRAGLDLKPTHESSHRAALSGLAEAGLGVALLPSMTIAMIDHPKLAKIKIVSPELYSEFGIVQRKDQAHGPAAAAFLETLTSILKQSRAAQETDRKAGVRKRSTI